MIEFILLCVLFYLIFLVAYLLSSAIGEWRQEAALRKKYLKRTFPRHVKK